MQTEVRHTSFGPRVGKKGSVFEAHPNRYECTHGQDVVVETYARRPPLTQRTSRQARCARSFRRLRSIDGQLLTDVPRHPFQRSQPPTSSRSLHLFGQGTFPDCQDTTWWQRGDPVASFCCPRHFAPGGSRSSATWVQSVGPVGPAVPVRCGRDASSRYLHAPRCGSARRTDLAY